MQLNSDTKKYMIRFYDILKDMIEGMTSARLTGSISHNFIVQMLPHHLAAIEMSKNVLEYTEIPELRKIALSIIDSQTKSIKDMLKVLPVCSTMYNLTNDVNLYQRRVNHIMSVMFSEMNNAYTDNNISADFIREMIPHHRGAVRMSENALSFSICHELVPILNSIITLQEQGIEEMEELLEKIV